ncbi:MAG: kelch repeat-containing protein [Planctomycetota bacterium]
MPAGIVSAQDLWSPMPGFAPSARGDAAMVADRARGEVLLFGGDDGTTLLDDTWSRGDRGWVERALAAAPAARSRHAMAYDAGRARVVLFGGHDGMTPLGDTWEWDGAAWRQVGASGPTARAGHAMAFDAASGTVLLVGGQDASGAALDETWAWDGSAWTSISSGAGPGPRFGHAMTPDRRRGEVVLFGGEAGTGAAALGDTWVWRGGWQKGATAGAGPGARVGAALAFDGHRERVVLFGGAPGAGLPALGDAWLWDGLAWMPTAATGPVPRRGHALAYDELRRRLVAFGGDDGSGIRHGDTWTFACSPWCDSGHATGGAHGLPSLVGQGGLESLAMGTSLSLSLSKARAQSAAVLVAGASSRYLPFQGGTLVPDPLLTVALPTGGSAGAPATVVAPFALPGAMPVGLPMHLQFWVLDAAGPAGFAVSNAVIGTTRRNFFRYVADPLDEMLSRAAPPATSLPIYSVQDFSTLTFVRNPSCWAASIDLTGLSPWNRAHANRRAGSLVSPRHVVFAKHYPLSTTSGSNDIAFVTSDNVTVVRQVVGVTYPAEDIGVGVLDADVPSEIGFFRVLPRGWNASLRRTAQMPALHLDQEEKALVRDMLTTGPGASYSYHETPSDPLRQAFSEPLIGGDSGNPAFLLINGEAVLILTHHFATGGPFYAFHRDVVNGAMTSLGGGGYQLSEVDFSSLPR